MKDRLTDLLRNIPVAHRVTVGIAAGVFVLLAVMFVRWVSAPTYTVLYSDLDDAAVATVIDELEGSGTPYRIEGGGSRVLVPREQLYTTRAALAEAEIGGTTTPEGYELLEEQGLTVSDFRQRVDYKRALEGELSRTLQAMEAVDSATVRLALPERQLFTEDEQPATASVLVDVGRPLQGEEVEAITFLVSNSVEGLEAADVSVSDTEGRMLAFPGEEDGLGAVSGRRQRQTRAFEQALSKDVTRLLQSSLGTGASVVVRADLDYDQTTTEQEIYDPDTQVATSEQTIEEEYQGTGAVPGGGVGVDGGPIDAEGGETDYQREEAIREYGVNREVVRTETAPGEVEQLSVAVVMDDGTNTGAPVPEEGEVEQLVAAAVGLDRERGDEISISAVPYPEPEQAELPAPSATDWLPQAGAVVVLLGIVGALFMMARRREEPPAIAAAEREGPVIWAEEPHQPRREPAGAVDDTSISAILGRTEDDERMVVREQLKSSVTDLVERQPDEIAVLLRSWLADRR